MFRYPKPIRWLLTKLFSNGKQPYLNEIGIDSYPSNHFGGIDTFGSLKCAIKARRTLRKTGVDPRDCWDMDSCFYEWLYTHLKQLLKDTNCDLTYRTYEHRGKTYTEGEYIEYLIDLCKQVMLFDEFKDCPDLDWDIVNSEDGSGKTIKFLNEESELEKLHEQTKKNYEELNHLQDEVFEVFRELIRALWW